MAGSRLHQLSELGQSVWIDVLSRDMLRSGELERLIVEDAVVGVTSNPTIFQKALAAGDAYDEQLKEQLADERDPKELFIRLAGKDVGDACDLLRGVWDGGRGLRGYVSIEVSPAALRAATLRYKGVESLNDLPKKEKPETETRVAASSKSSD